MFKRITLKISNAIVAFLLIIAYSDQTFGKLEIRALNSCKDFPSYDQIETLLHDYADQNPDFVKVLAIGQSVEGRSIWALRISQDPNMETVEPEIRITGGIHGNECISVSTVLAIIDWLIMDYGSDPLVDDLVDSAEFLIVPLVNPDGYSGDTSTRNNANDVDLNRNFGFGWSYEQGNLPFTEPESIALRNISQVSNFTIGLSYHTRALYINAPWNFSPFHPRDESLFEAMGNSYASDSGYNVVFGWDWYQTSGDVNDWSLGTMGTFDWTIELSSDLDLNWDVHKPGVRGFLSWVFKGIEGVVVDSKTGGPLWARIIVEPEGEPVFTDPDVGDYHRILLPGTYQITAIANGYEPKTISNVIVPAQGVVSVDFELSRSNVPSLYGMAVNRMIMYQEITNSYFQTSGYDNTTEVSDALGPPDGWYYSMGPSGEITIDMGATTPIRNGEGYDLRVISGTRSNDLATVLVSPYQDGPFVQVAQGTGDMHADLALHDLDTVRYVRIIDQGDSQFGSPYSGYDIDAVENLSPIGLGESPDSDNSVTDSDDPGIDSDSPSQWQEDVSVISGCTLFSQIARRSHSLLEILL